MRREEILKEIAVIDEEITKVVSSSKLPSLEQRPFPLGTWVMAALCFAWLYYGYLIPGAYGAILQSATFAYYGGYGLLILATLLTISWAWRKRSYKHHTDNYYTVARMARELQQRREDLQAELRAISGK